eukprot:1176353-Prorocentrum_minimum.AAC.6
MTRLSSKSICGSFNRSHPDTPRGQEDSYQAVVSREEPESAAPTKMDQESEAKIKRCVEGCRIDEIFVDSKFLEADSLLQLVEALVWASGRPEGAKRGVGNKRPALPRESA